MKAFGGWIGGLATRVTHQENGLGGGRQGVFGAHIIMVIQNTLSLHTMIVCNPPELAARCEDAVLKPQNAFEHEMDT